MPIIEASHISKSFRMQTGRPRSFQELLVGAFGRGFGRTPEPFWALRDVSFAVERGETLGLIGHNGSGKSTCLKLLTRILQPTSGRLTVQGRVSALLELGAGFHPELTGRENVYLHGSVLGLSRREVAKTFDDVVAFAELQRFIDVPVKFYSSGMYVRLAFATAINVNPDILLIDEVLAVGDQSFQTKCLRRVHEMKEQGVTIVFVSHGLDSVMSLCDRAIWLDDGVLRDDGMTDVVLRRYLQDLSDNAAVIATQEVGASAPEVELQPVGVPAYYAGNDAPDGAHAAGNGYSNVVAASEPSPATAGQQADATPQADGPARWGTRELEITEVQFVDRAGQISNTLTTGEPATVILRYRADRRIPSPVFGVAFHRADGLHISGTNTLLARMVLGDVQGDGEVYYRVAALPLLEGSYYLSVAAHSADNSATYDYQRMSHPFSVIRDQATTGHEGVVHIPASWRHIANPRRKDGGN
jgi:ABC-type polysaccharide/polyol phosphate transport system ATPase subunit